MEKADLLAIYDRDGFDEVFIVSQNGEEVAHYVLVNRDDTTQYPLPEGAVAIEVPLRNLVVDSEVYAAALEELGCQSLISGMFDADFVTSPHLVDAIKEGKIKNMGQPSSPNIEKIIELQPDAIILSYFDGMQVQGLDKLGIPIIKMYDLQESSPLGRAEWLRLLGRLSGQEEKADSIFSTTSDKYLMSTNQKGGGPQPKVLTEIMYEGTWYVPGGNSYQAQLIRDAGANYFKKDNHSSGSLNLTAEQVIAEGADSDIWLIRFFGDGEQLKNILNSDPVYGEVKAFKEGRVYFSDTSRSGLFREFPFHPQLVLEDYRKIFSNDTTGTLHYFKRLE